MPRQAAICAFSVSMVTPECSISNRTNSAPAAFAIWGMPGVKNSKTMVPKTCLPARKSDLTWFVLIDRPHDLDAAGGHYAYLKIIRVGMMPARQYLLESGIFGNMRSAAQEHAAKQQKQ
jgi:hypothetical protein